MLELQERFGGRRVLITGGGGSIGGALATLLLGFRPERVTLLDSHEASLTADRRARNAAAARGVEHVLGDIRDGGRLDARRSRARGPTSIFHLAAYKHVDWAETHPEEFVDTNLQGSWNVLRAAEAAGVDTVVVASTDKAALAASFYGRTKRFMEQLTAFSARERGGAAARGPARQRARQRRQRLRAVPAPGARRRPADRHRHRDGALLDHGRPRRARLAHGALLAAEGERARDRRRPGRAVRRRARRAHLARARARGRDRRHRAARHPPRRDADRGARPARARRSAARRRQGIAAITGGPAPPARPGWPSASPARGGREEARAVWLEAMRRPGLLVPARS